ncbi:GNAT family N-acetyltransferase [Vibrio artabrorum]|uniref:GNAT family N-acetyltransferase n=1 Tax=Vibrio artabrorum TaxID=446374 RepID=A0ABT8CIP8_9VIBR|nr:GNAT family N-acetyltransferase [Vibrio artabrorum]EGQ8312757.1 GNAT family N-acetyltransferase [Vibrio cholerae]EGR5448321.1 GNAT family N-acetyltransferase [Vibrio cholerae]EGR5456664.1 GNAT family N-acetyltransferase [Vibrio cholerae]EGR5464528.1 GNAT family N-acetyltransferase [Vibrio cholerae]ELH4196081.1 GNAT family N-acetyltransferase [Vibrio cholerae]
MINYRHNYPLDPQDVARVFDSSGIIRPSNNIPRIKRMLDGANLTFSAWDEDTLIGVCRALTDFSYCCYLSDLAVDAKYQGKGIGKHLISMVQEAIGEEVSLILLSAAGAINYYPHIGLSKADNAFILKRSR